MSIIGGVPSPRIVLKSGGLYGTTVDDVTLSKFSEFRPVYEPDFLTHEVYVPATGLWEKRRKLNGYRFRVEIYYAGVDATELIKLSKLLNLNTGYDTVLIYPWSTGKPGYYIDVTIDDDAIGLLYWKLLAHKDFSLKLVSRMLLDYIPLSQPDVILAGDVSWAIQDIVGAIEDLD